MLAKFFYRSDTTISKDFKDYAINDDIADNERIRLRGEEGDMIGIMSAREAKVLANEKHLDLVKITPNADPPVCRLMNYGKYKFDQIKKAKEAQKKQQVEEEKGIRLSMRIDTHDLETKAKQARKFIAAGAKVKVSIRMRGREQAHNHLGIEVMNEFYKQLEDIATIIKQPAVDGRNIFMILIPTATATK